MFPWSISSYFQGVNFCFFLLFCPFFCCFPVMNTCRWFGIFPYMSHNAAMLLRKTAIVQNKRQRSVARQKFEEHTLDLHMCDQGQLE
jgi:hypothetical protein